MEIERVFTVVINLVGAKYRLFGLNTNKFMHESQAHYVNFLYLPGKQIEYFL